MATHPKIEKRWICPEKGYGLFSTAPIHQGEVVVRDVGRILTQEQYFLLTPEQQNLTYQIDRDKVLVPLDFQNISDEWFVNHSCDPNTMYAGGSKWLAARDIFPGEEITHDYALLWANDLEPFEINPCLCGTKKCRGEMTGNDWMKSEVQAKYMYQFFPFIREKIQQRVSIT